MGFPSKQAFQNPTLVALGVAILANYDQSLFEARMELETRRTAWEDAQEQLKMDALMKEMDAKSPSLTELIEAGTTASMMTSEQIKKAAFVEKMRAAKAAKKAQREAVAG